MRDELILAASIAGLILTTLAEAQTALGTIHLGQAVLADGKPLPAGTYRVQQTGDELKPAVGQSSAGERWVEFVQGARTVGREVATIVPDSEMSAIAEGPRPKANSARVDTLKGGDYVRVWINRGGVNYIINMPPAR